VLQVAAGQELRFEVPVRLADWLVELVDWRELLVAVRHDWKSSQALQPAARRVFQLEVRAHRDGFQFDPPRARRDSQRRAEE
jgi:hypothetical protein